MLLPRLYNKNKKLFIALILGVVVFGNILTTFDPSPVFAQQETVNPTTGKPVEGEKTIPETDPTTGVPAGDSRNTPKGIFGWLFGDILIDGTFGFFAKVFAYISNIIFTILGWIVKLAAALFDAVLNPSKSGASTLEQFTKAPIVQTGWKISRDLANMFFALILIIISFATILRLENYGAKNLIKKVIIAALLINFSLVIAGIAIDFSQVLTKYFFSAISGDKGVSVKIMSAIEAHKMLKPPDLNQTGAIGDVTAMEQNIDKKEVGGVQQFLKIVVNMLFGSVILLVTAFVLGAGAILLIVRVIVLWFLLILAPLVWLAYILPTTSGYFGTWWQKFFKQAFFAPAYAFFLYLAISILEKGPIIKTSANTAFSAGFIINYIIIIGLLFGALLAAQQMGAYGASGAVSLGKKWGKGAAFGIGKGIGRATERWAARGAEKEGKYWGRFRRATSYFSPKAWKTAWQAHKTQREKESYPVAIGARQDMISRYLSWGTLKPWSKDASGERKFRFGGGERTDYRERATRFRRAELRRDIQSNNAEELIAGFEQAKNSNNVSKMAAYLQALTEQNDQNEILRHYNKNFGTKYSMTAEGFADFLEGQIKPKMGEQQTYRLGHDLTRMMENNGQWIGRMYKVDAKTGKYSTQSVSQQDILGHQKNLEDKIAAGVKAGATQQDKDDAKAAAEKLARMKESLKGAKIDVDLLFNPNADKAKIDAEVAKLNSRAWSQRTDDEKKLMGDMARANAHVEWSKQDPQRQTIGTGRFSYIREEYNEKGETIDGGLTDEGKEKIIMLSPTNANRMHAHSKTVLMYKHSSEVAQLNSGAYDKMLEDIGGSAKAIDPADNIALEKFIKAATSNVPGLTPEELAGAKAMVKEAISKHGGRKPKEGIVTEDIETEFQKSRQQYRGR